MPRISLIEDLTKEAIPAGYNLLVEFDPSSDWYPASVTMAAGWIRTGGQVSYNVACPTATKYPLSTYPSEEEI